MITIDNRHCEHPGCTHRPVFGFETDTEVRFCDEHKQPGMINIVDNRCSMPGCPHINPCFGFPPGHVSDAPAVTASSMAVPRAIMRCKNHIEPGMIDVRHPRCSCPLHKRAIFFVPGATPKIMFCFVCKPANAISDNPICEEELCDVRAIYGPLFEQARHCATHGKELDASDRRKYCEFTERFPHCQTEGCVVRPTFSERDDNYPTHCPEHAPLHAREIETGTCIKCTHPDLINHLTHMCIYCELGGDRASTKSRQKRQEDMMNKVLTDLNMPPTTRDHVLPQLLQCGLRDRPDFHYNRGWFMLIIENDEHQHGNTAMIFDSNGIPALLSFPDDYDVPIELAPVDPVEIYKAQKNARRSVAPSVATVDGASTSATSVRTIRRVGYSRNMELARMIAIQCIMGVPVIFIRYNPDEYVNADRVRCPKARGRDRYVIAANYARDIMNKLPTEKPAEDDPLRLRGLYVAYLYYNGQRPGIGDAFHVDVGTRNVSRWDI